MKRDGIELSFIVTVIESDFDNLLILIHSFRNMHVYVETELIIEAQHLSDSSVIKLEKIIHETPQISYYINYNASRCTRKDYGLEHAKANYLSYIDADCILDKDYYLNVKKYLYLYKVIRGKNIYLHNKKYLSRCNAIYRTLCDDIVFYDETFTPNLIIEKNFLRDLGGWQMENTDSGDDYTLSQRLKRSVEFEIKHCDEVLIKINNTNEKWEKIYKTWIGYGLAYQVRRRNAGECDIKTFVKYIPPFVYRLSQPIYYFPMAIINWIVIFSGYCEQIRLDKKIVQRKVE